MHNPGSLSLRREHLGARRLATSTRRLALLPARRETGCEAGAIDYYGPSLGLPDAICGCGTYWFFGPGTKPGTVLVTIGVAEAGLRRFYGDVTTAGRLVDTLAVPEEQDVPLFVSTDPKTTLQALWPRLDPRCDSCSR